MGVVTIVIFEVRVYFEIGLGKKDKYKKMGRGILVKKK